MRKPEYEPTKKVYTNSATLIKQSAPIGQSLIGIKKYRDTFVEINVDTNQKAVLVMTENYLPGWHATLNGKPVDIFDVNYLYQGVMVPSGKSTVIFYHENKKSILGQYISLLSLVILIGYGLFLNLSKTTYSKEE